MTLHADADRAGGVGGIIFGTLLAMMRLSSFKRLSLPADRLRQPDAVDPAACW